MLSLNYYSMNINSPNEVDLMTRKEQKEMRQKQIMFKALELFVANGYSETKISDIAEALGISVGLLFHYYESKEKLYEALVVMGAEHSKISEEVKFDDPLDYFTNFINMLFTAAEQQPWVYQMFILMQQARHPNMPDNIRQLALSVNKVDFTAEIIRQGQKRGSIKEGDPTALSFAFWCSIQGIMQLHLIGPEYPLPKAEWITDILRKR